MAKTRRENGAGSVYERKDRPGIFRASFSYTDTVTGKTETKTFDRKTKKEALAAGKKWREQREKGLLPEADKITLGEWIDTWLKQYIKPNVRVKSYDKYEGCLLQYVKPKIGNVLLHKLREPQLTALFNELLATGGKKGKGLSSSTVKATRRYLSMCLEQAIKSDMLMKNPVKQTKPIKLVKAEIQTLTENQAADLIVAAQVAAKQADQDYTIKAAAAAERATSTGKQITVPMFNIVYHSAYMAILIALNTGMRLGEIFGLSWDAVDVKAGVIYVKRALVTSKSGVNFSEPKTKSSRRQIPLSSDVAAELRKYKKLQEWRGTLLGDLWDTNNYNLVITGEWGSVFNTSNFTSRYFKPLIKQIGAADSFKFHDLRHTHATLLLLKGIPVKVVSERLGHSTVTMTMDTYSHVLPEMQAEAVKVLEGMFTKKLQA